MKQQDKSLAALGVCPWFGTQLVRVVVMPEFACGAFWTPLRFHKRANRNFVRVVRVHEEAPVPGAANTVQPVAAHYWEFGPALGALLCPDDAPLQCQRRLIPLRPKLKFKRALVHAKYKFYCWQIHSNHIQPPPPSNILQGILHCLNRASQTFSHGDGAHKQRQRLTRGHRCHSLC